MQFGVRSFFNACTILFMELVLYISLAASSNNVECPESIAGLFFTFFVIMMSILNFHYLSWWNAYVDTIPNSAFDRDTSLRSQIVGTLLALLAKGLMLLPTLSSGGLMESIINSLIMGILGSCMGADILLIFIILIYKRLARHLAMADAEGENLHLLPDAPQDLSLQKNLLADPLQESTHQKSSPSQVALAAPSTFFGILGNSLFILGFSFISLLAPFGMVDLTEKHLGEWIALCCCVILVSYLCARFCLRTQQVLFSPGNRVWQNILQKTIYSSILSILFTSYFPIRQIFPFAPISAATNLVGFSLFGASVGTLCFLLSYKYSQKQISWTGLRILPEAKS